MNEIENEAIKYLSWIYTNKYIKITLIILFALYFVISPKISNVVKLLYDNIIFNILIILLIIFLSKYDQHLAIIIISVYLLTLNKTKKLKEKNIIVVEENPSHAFLINSICKWDWKKSTLHDL